MFTPEGKEYGTELKGRVFGKGKDAPSKFETTILVSPSATDQDKVREAWLKYSQLQKTVRDYLIVLKSGEQDMGILLHLMQGGCRGLIIEAGGLLSHAAVLSRELIQKAMREENKHDKVLIGGVENASTLLHDGQNIEVDLVDPNNVKIVVK